MKILFKNYNIKIQRGSENYMERKWVLILGRVLIFIGFIILIANFVFNYLSSVNGNEAEVISQVDALSLLLPGIILVGFNRVLNKLNRLQEVKKVDNSPVQKKEKQVISSDDQLKDYK